MPNGGLTPDCVHCKHYKGKPLTEEEPFCQHHEINLPSPIRAFCKNYTDPEPTNDVDWLDSELNRDELGDGQMYLWLGGYEIKFFHVKLASIVEYGNWDRDTFMEHIRILSDKH